MLPIWCTTHRPTKAENRPQEGERNLPVPQIGKFVRRGPANFGPLRTVTNFPPCLHLQEFCRFAVARTRERFTYAGAQNSISLGRLMRSRNDRLFNDLLNAVGVPVRGITFVEVQHAQRCSRPEGAPCTCRPTMVIVAPRAASDTGAGSGTHLVPPTDTERRKEGGTMADEQDSLIDIGSVSEIVAISPTHIRTMVRCKAFPPPIKLGRSARWSRFVIQSWIEAKVGELCKDQSED